jgi:hypothetical protein
MHSQSRLLSFARARPRTLTEIFGVSPTVAGSIGPGSGGLDHDSVALLCGLRRGAENGADSLPRQSGASCGDDGVDELLLAAGASNDGALQKMFLDRDLFGEVGVEVLETLGELIGVVEDVLD